MYRSGAIFMKIDYFPRKIMLKTQKMNGASGCLNIIKIAWIGCAFVKKHLYIFIKNMFFLEN